MTRINANLPPKELTRAHLVAELREITMVPASLRRSLKTKSMTEVCNKIPPKFTLNKGHVTFFYDKIGFLKRRFHMLADEMERRGYFVDRSRDRAFDGFDERWQGDWQSNETDNNIVRERIALRISQKPHLYKDFKG